MFFVQACCEGISAMINIDEFRKVDLRVGTVKSAEPHPNADKLLVLRVDLGAEERQIVAGIRGQYDPAALVGRQIVVVANLEAAKLRGIESQGMLLAASDGDRIVILTADKTVTPGAKVS
jgi:methionine--tRNA ligase beta chain